MAVLYTILKRRLHYQVTGQYHRMYVKPKIAVNIKCKYRSLSKLQVYYVKVLYIVTEHYNITCIG